MCAGQTGQAVGAGGIQARAGHQLQAGESANGSGLVIRWNQARQVPPEPRGRGQQVPTPAAGVPHAAFGATAVGGLLQERAELDLRLRLRFADPSYLGLLQGLLRE